MRTGRIQTFIPCFKSAIYSFGYTGISVQIDLKVNRMNDTQNPSCKISARLVDLSEACVPKSISFASNNLFGCLESCLVFVGCNTWKFCMTNKFRDILSQSDWSYMELGPFHPLLVPELSLYFSPLMMSIP